MKKCCHNSYKSLIKWHLKVWLLLFVYTEGGRKWHRAVITGRNRPKAKKILTFSGDGGTEKAIICATQLKPRQCSWPRRARTVLFSRSSAVSQVFSIQQDGELRDLFLLREEVQGRRAKNARVVTVHSGPDTREQVVPEPKTVQDCFITAPTVSQALADVSTMCETTSPSAEDALFNNVAPHRAPQP